MLVSILQGKFNGVFDLAGLRLPCAYIQSTQESDMEFTLLPLVLTKTDCRHESSSVEGDRCCCRHVDSNSRFVKNIRRTPHIDDGLYNLSNSYICMTSAGVTSGHVVVLYIRRAGLPREKNEHLITYID